MELSNYFTGVGDDCCRSPGNLSSWLLLSKKFCFSNCKQISLLLYLFMIQLLHAAGRHGDSWNPIECNLCCKPCYVSGHCCWVLCAYNTCFLGQYERKHISLIIYYDIWSMLTCFVENILRNRWAVEIKNSGLRRLWVRWEPLSLGIYMHPYLLLH